MEKEFKVIIKARRYNPNSNVSSTEGYIVEYEGEFFFIHTPDDGYDLDNPECWSWRFDIERHWCFEEVDFERLVYTMPNSSKHLCMSDLEEA